MLFDAAAPLGVSSSGPHNAAIFQPIAADTAQTVLIGIAIGLFLLGAAVFTRREYH
jgi:hypothetical protein